MNPVDEYLQQLTNALRVRGTARRRFVRECRDHLTEAAAAAEVGAEAAVRAFGPAGQIAASFDAAVAARRGARSTAITAVAVLATGASALALIQGATPDAVAPLWLAGLFFVAAQLAAVSAGLGAIQGLGMRRLPAAPGALALLARRNACALLAAGFTLFAAGAALPGHGSAVAILAGPVLLGVGAVAVIRARRLARNLPGTRQRIIRPPADDLATLVRFSLPTVTMSQLLTATTVCAAAAAFVWDHGEQATLVSALAVAGFEATAVLLCFLTLGPALGLRTRATVVPH